MSAMFCSQVLAETPESVKSIGWSRMMFLHLGRRWLFLHHLVMLSLTCLMINRKLLDMSTFLRLRKDQMVRRLQFLIGAAMIVRSEGRWKWSLHLTLTLPGDVHRASPGWMFLEFVTMLSVERSELPVVVPDIPAAPLPPADLAIMDQPMLDGPAGPDEDSVAPMEFGLVDLCQCGVLFNPSSLSGLDLMSDVRFHVESIAYDGSKGECKVIDFCGSRVKLWKPSHVISDTTLGELDPEGTFKAMQKECDGLTAVKAGVILSEQKKEEFCKLHGVKPITCRWVTNEKPESDEGVRARIVVKDIARGSATARSLAISSPTPSVESLRMVLGASCGICRGAELSLYAIDVSQAFMNSPLRDKERIVLRMPLSISTTSGEPIFLEAHKALNGLRVASLTWSVFLKDIVSKVGLACSATEPCLYGGVIDGSPTLLLCYVGDLLIASSTDKAFHRVFKELSKHVKVRETGRIALGKDGGGSLKFLGRVISRRAGSP